jgi:hypothetical protein
MPEGVHRHVSQAVNEKGVGVKSRAPLEVGNTRLKKQSQMSVIARVNDWDTCVYTGGGGGGRERERERDPQTPPRGTRCR